MGVQRAAIRTWVSLYARSGKKSQQNRKRFFSILFLYAVVDACAEMLDEEKFIGEVRKRSTLYDITLND